MEAMRTNPDKNLLPWAFVAISLAGYSWLTLVAAWSGFFYWGIFVFALHIVGIVGMKHRSAILAFLKENRVLLLWVLALAVIFASLLDESTFFSGRDQGSISQAAIELAKNHSLPFSSESSTEFFRIYGEGKALHFPGFFYSSSGSLVTQFPLPAITWYASFYTLFDMRGFAIANGVLIFFFLISFSLLGKSFLGKRPAYIFLALAATSFPLYWFSRYTLSENFMLGFVWAAAWSLVAFIMSTMRSPSEEEPKKGKPSDSDLLFWSFVGCASLLPLARIEGLLILPLAVGTLLYFKESRRYVLRSGRTVAIVSGVFLLLFLINVSFTLPFFKSIAKAVMTSSATQSASEALGAITGQWELLKVFTLYGMLPSMLCGIAALAVFVKKQRSDAVRFIPFFIMSPAFIYLLHSFISQDHPWMLRRFSFCVLPALTWYAAFFIIELARSHRARMRMTAVALFTLLLSANMISLAYFFPFNGGDGLLEQTKTLADTFDDSDLILVDRMTTGDPWTMLPGPMMSHFGKNAVYFINPDDLKKIDLGKFDRTFLLIPETNTDYYRGTYLWPHMRKTGETSFSLRRMKSDPTDTDLPNPESIRQSIHIYSLELPESNL